MLTKHLLEGIRLGKAKTNDNGLISASAIYQYAAAEVVKAGQQKPRFFGLEQHGGELFIARAAAMYSVERLQIFKKLINELDTNEEIDEEIAEQARRVIRDNQPKRDKNLLRLLDLLQKGMKPGKFSGQWMKTFVATGSLQQQVPQVPQASPVATAPGSVTSVPVPSGPKKQSQSPTGFTDDLNGVKLDMVYVPGGTFKMGSPKGSGSGDERPQHDVTVSAFYIGKSQITQAQWKAVMGKNPSSFKGDDLPVETVSWEDAKQFCQKLQQLTNKAYRLPSEAEWEYACRAGTTGDYAGKLDDMGWYDSNSRNKTHPVGQKNPNAFGLYDMHGNVWEWCEDIHGDYKNTPADGSAWLSGEDSSSRRVVRGGSWGSLGVICRSASRDHFAPGNRLDDIGFRVVVAARSS